VKDLEGRNVLLTGGSRGLGPYIGRALAQKGANVALTARTADALGAVAQELADLGVRTAAIPADISDPKGLEEMLGRARAEMQKIDILINNAGVEHLSPFAELSPDSVESMIQTNLVAPMLLTRLLLPEMLERGSGHVVSISSLGGKKGSPYSATYAATKAALIEWTSSIREEMRGTGVGASVICPGFVSESGMFAVQNRRAPRLMGETTPEAVATAVVRAIEGDIGEIIVNPGPVKLLLAANAISPAIGSWILRASGVYEFFRQGAEEWEAQTQRGGGEDEPPEPSDQETAT
jgi:short-subunit dehydrogenase